MKTLGNFVLWAVLVGWVLSGRSLAAPPCGGDCDDGGDVTVDELITGVGIALGDPNAAQCHNMDSDGDGDITVDEIVGAVSNALFGCPSFSGEFFGIVTLDAGRSATVNLDVQTNGQATATVTITTAASVFRGGGAAETSIPVSGSVDVDTGTYSLEGSYADGGTTHTVNLDGALPLQAMSLGTLNFQLDAQSFSGSIARGSGATPTPTRTMVLPTPTPTATAMPSGPVDPAMLGTWSGTARNQSTGASKQVRISIELQGNDVVVTDLGGNLYKTAPASIIMNAPTRTTLVYNVFGNPVIVFNLTLGDNQLGGIYSATTPAIPPIIDAFGLVLTKEVPLAPDPRLAGIWSGTGNLDPSGQIQAQLQLDIQGENVVVTDVGGNVFSHVASPITMHVDGGPTYLAFVCDTGPCGGGNPVVTFNLSLLASGRLVGVYYEISSTPRRVGLNLGKQ